MGTIEEKLLKLSVDDYESLPTTSMGINMMAGAMAGVLEHIVMYPMDSVKTRMQSLLPSTSKYNITATFTNMVKKEGLLRPIRGVTAVVAGAGPAHALYFGFYEMSKEHMTKFTTYGQLNYLASGAFATLIHDAVSNPAEVIKQRLQMYNSPYKSVVACMRGIYQKEGIKAFYRSYSTQLVMNIPTQTIHFSTYELFQNILNHERKYNPPVHVIAGGAAGACAAAITTPLDVVKTLLNTQETGLVKSMMEAINKIYSVAGPRGFFKGLTARVLYSMPATAICWSTYEFFKFYLCGVDRDLYKSTITGQNMLQPRKTSTSDVVDDIHIPNAYLMISVPETSEELKNPKESSSVTTVSHSHTAPPTATTSPIKTVCELSTSVTSPTLNLTTRHTDVKNPFDRGFSSP